ncbi:Leucine-rich repeat domain superfamily [Sesbania bispinosa]|nr:Leucine-rich repeat domain superfamily [Sesbania bispinosa]
MQSAKALLEKQHLQELELRWRDDDDEKFRVVRQWSPQLQLVSRKAEPENNYCLEDEMILQGLQPHHSVKKLVIAGFCGERLPDWIGNLSSLSSLEIRNCSGLRFDIAT